ncbi:DUF7093 family protein [Halalkalicoccus tibetensis]|uniref:Oxidoreductase n=1 Tax=Halalkalicoccus tibetensis TaxID=175632 RepID=A0ABD5V209_9EURY
MSLRCSLLGHEYGESEIERDREERGNEVVISVVELERCTRCGATRTISENTEVTQLSGATTETTPGPPRSGTEPAAPGDSGPGIEPRSNVGSGEGEPGIRARSTEDVRTTSSGNARAPSNGDGWVPSGDDGRTRSDEDTRPRATNAPSTADHQHEARDGSGAGIGTNPDPASEDAEVMDDEGGEDREPGAWPDVGDHEEPSAGWPSVEGEDEGFDAEAPDGRTDLEFGGGLTPQANQGAEIMKGEDAGDGESTFVSAGPSSAPDRPTGSEATAALYCPNCGTRGLEARDSLRAGDICPECHKGYLAEGER